MAGVQSKTVNYGETASVITTRSEERRTLETGGWAGAARMGNYRSGDHQHQPATPPLAFLPSTPASHSSTGVPSSSWDADGALVVIQEFQLSIFPRKLSDDTWHCQVSNSDLYWSLRNASDHFARQTRRHGGGVQWYSFIIKSAAILSFTWLDLIISCTVVVSLPLLPSLRVQSIIYFCISENVSLHCYTGVCSRCAPV